MDLSRPAAPASVPAPAAATAHLVAEFRALHADLQQRDTYLTSWEESTITYPGEGVDAEYDAVAARLDAARTALAAARPDATDLTARLGADALKVSRTAGELAQMSAHCTVFGPGWSTLLDAPVRDAAEALALLGAPVAAA